MSWGRLPGQDVPEGELDWRRREHPSGQRLHDRYVFVTGSGRGFGRLIALEMAREGAHVAVHYNRSREGAEEVARQIREIGRKATVIQGNITQWADVKQMATEAWQAFGRMDVLVNNAGEVSATQMSWRDITEDAIDQTLAVDVKGTLLCIHEFGQRMLEQKSGVIVNIASNVVTTGSPRAPQYAASKYGILGLTKSYALAFAPFVRVNAVGPGYMDTEALRRRKDWTPQRRKWIVDHTPMRAIGKPENIVPIVLFLASDDSLHMTGNFVLADGGFSMIGA